MSQTFFNLFYPLTMTLLITVPVYIVFNLKLSNIYFLFYNLILYLVLSIFIRLDNNVISLIICVLITIVYTYTISKQFLVSIIVPFFSFLSLSFCDILTGFIIYSVYPYDLHVIKSNLLLYFIVGVLILFLDVIFSLFLKRTLYKNLFSMDYKVKSKNFSAFIILAVTTIVVIILIYSKLLKYLFSLNEENFNILYLLISLLILTILISTNYTLVKYVQGYINERLIANENKYLKEYSDMLENSSMDLRRFKHDYLNIMATLGGLINSDKIDELKDYYNNELVPANNILVDKNNLVTLLKNLKIAALKSLVSSKTVSAQTKGIEMKIEIFDEVSNVNMKTFDLCRIMGILLDNAIEASQYCNNKFVHFAIVTTDEATIFIVLNSCPPNCPPVYKLYENNFSTKGKNRGLGLTTVKQIINSTKNALINTTIENNTFKQEIIINN